MAARKVKSLYGDYRDPLQNHKFDSQLILDKKTNTWIPRTSLSNILHNAKRFYGKHVGSKKLQNILWTLNRAN